MSQVKPSSGLFDANKKLFFAAPFAYGYYTLEPYAFGEMVDYTIGAVLCGLAASILIIKGIHGLYKNYSLRLDWAEAQSPFTEKHHGRFMTHAEIAAHGMYNPNSGRLIGQEFETGRLIFAPPKTIFSLIYGGQGTGKSSTQASASTILSAVRTRPRDDSPYSLMIKDCKNEFAVPIARFYKEQGFEVDFLNPTGNNLDLCPHSNYNLFEAAVDAYYSDDPQRQKNTTSLIRRLVDIITPKGDMGKQNIFFSGNGRRTNAFLIKDRILTMPEEATPSHVFRLASDPEKAKKRLLYWACRNDIPVKDKVAFDTQRDAKALLKALEKDSNSDHWGSFLSYVSNALAIFDESGHLSEEGEYAVKRIADIRKKPKILIIITPLEYQEDFALYQTLFIEAILQACKANPTGVPVHQILEEFTTSKLIGFEKEMVKMRGLSLSAEIYIQDKNELSDQNGENAAKTIVNQCDIQQYLAFNYPDAKEVSAMLGTVPRKRADVSRAGGQYDEFNISSKDADIPLMSPQQLLTMPDDEQIIRLRSKHFIHCRKIPVWEIEYLRDCFDENTLEGTFPDVPPKAGLKASKNGIELIWPKVPRKFRKVKAIKTRMLQFSSFLWLYAWTGILLAYRSDNIEWQVPAMRTEYTYRQVGNYKAYLSCDYIALNGESYTDYSTDCPFITLRPLEAKQEDQP